MTVLLPTSLAECAPCIVICLVRISQALPRSMHVSPEIICVYVGMCMYIYAFDFYAFGRCLSLYASVFFGVHLCGLFRICMYVCIYVCICVCVCVCMCVCLCVCGECSLNNHPNPKVCMSIHVYGHTSTGNA